MTDKMERDIPTKQSDTNKAIQDAHEFLKSLTDNHLWETCDFYLLQQHLESIAYIFLVNGNSEEAIKSLLESYEAILFTIIACTEEYLNTMSTDVPAGKIHELRNKLKELEKEFTNMEEKSFEQYRETVKQCEVLLEGVHPILK